MIDNDSHLDMRIQVSVPESTAALPMTDAGDTDKRMSGFVGSVRSMDGVKHHSPVEPKSLGSLTTGG